MYMYYVYVLCICIMYHVYIKKEPIKLINSIRLDKVYNLLLFDINGIMELDVISIMRYLVRY